MSNYRPIAGSLPPVPIDLSGAPDPKEVLALKPEKKKRQAGVRSLFPDLWSTQGELDYAGSRELRSLFALAITVRDVIPLLPNGEARERLTRAFYRILRNAKPDDER